MKSSTIGTNVALEHASMGHVQATCLSRWLLTSRIIYSLLSLNATENIFL